MADILSPDEPAITRGGGEVPTGQEIGEKKQSSWAAYLVWITSTALRVAILISIFLICLSGTLMIDSDSVPFVLSDLSIATFNAVYPSTNGTFTVTFHWFLCALDWHYPAGIDSTLPGQHPAGMVYNIDGFVPRESLTLPTHIFGINRYPLRQWLDKSCMPEAPKWIVPGPAWGCQNSSLSVFAHAATQSFSTDLTLYCYYAAFILVFTSAFQNTMPIWLLTTATLFVAAASATLGGARLMAYSDNINAGEMSVKLSPTFQVVAWGVVAASFLAGLPVLFDWWTGRKTRASWLVERSVADLMAVELIPEGMEEVELFSDEVEKEKGPGGADDDPDNVL